MEIHYLWPINHLALNSQTFEVIFRNTTNGKYNWFISQEFQGNSIGIGLNIDGLPVVQFSNSEYVLEEWETLNDEACHQLSVVFVDNMIVWYIDGEYVSTTQARQALGFNDTEKFTIGNNLQTNEDYFQGTLEDMRLFSDIRTSSEISSNAFLTIEQMEDNRFFYLPFSKTAHNYSQDPYHGHLFGHLGGLNYSTNFQPNWVLENCVNSVGIESVGGICSAYNPILILPQPNELVINGGFEQFCSGLNTSPNWALPENAFIHGSNFSGWSLNSDVANWNTTFSSVTNVPHSPDFYVRNGLGGIPPVWPYTTVFTAAPVNTHNNTGNAFAGLYCEGATHELLECGLSQTLKPNTTYKFSCWAYVPSLTYTTTNFTHSYDAHIKVEISNGTTTLNPLGFLTASHYSSVSGNNNWQFISGSFTTPSSLPVASYDKLKISNIYSNSTAPGAMSYAFIDDVSLKEVLPTNWPQFIGTTNLPDKFIHDIKIDGNDNVIVMGDLTNSPMNTSFGIPQVQSSTNASASQGYYLAKYSSTGNLLWQKIFPHLICNAIAIDANNDIYTVGATEAGIASSNFTLSTQSNATNWGTTNMFVQKVSGINGLELDFHAFGGAGAEYATDVVINNNDIYISVNMAIYNGNAPLLQWGGGAFQTTTLIVRANITSGFSPIQPNNQGTSFGSDIRAIDFINNRVVAVSESHLFSFNSLLTLASLITTPVNDGVEIYAASNGSVYTLNKDEDVYINLQLPTSYDKKYVELKKWNVTSSVHTQQASKKFLYYNSVVGNIYQPTFPVVYAKTITDLNGDIVVGMIKDYGTNCDQPGAYVNCDNTLIFEQWNSNLSTKIWLVESSQQDALFSGDLAIANFSGNTKSAFIGDFYPEQNNWSVSLGSKVLSGTGVSGTNPDKNSIVSTLEDMGATGSYKMHNQNEEHSELNIYPNPVNSKLTISNTVIIERIYIFDLQGRLLMSKEPKEKQVEIDVADLAEGVYLINVKDHIGDHTLKFKKQ